MKTTNKLSLSICFCRASAMSGALDVIHWRRWLYFAFVAATLSLLVLLVAIFCVPIDCAFCTTFASWLNPLFSYSKQVLSNFSVSWTYALLWLSVIFAIIFAILSWLKHCAFSRTLDRASAAWSDLKNSIEPR